MLFANQQVLDDSDVAQSLVEQHVAATEFTADSRMQPPFGAPSVGYETSVCA